MNVAAVEAWLQSYTGLESAAIGSDAVVRAARERITATGALSVEAYVACLEESIDERNALIDRVVVPETWFFRDRPAIDAFAERVAKNWSRNRAGRTLRILSVPCSTGEEPYSLAMALALAGWPLALLHIDAVDISHRNLQRARRGIYGRNSFRGDDLGYRDVYLEPVDAESWRVRDRVRAPIRFELGNVLAEDFGRGRQPYDTIFCRNLLIYFDRVTQARAIRTLDRLLAPEGWFAVGPAEPVLLFPHGYVLLPVRSAFLLRRVGATAAAPAAAPPPAPEANAVEWRAVARPAAPEPEEPTADPLAACAEVQQLADAGRLREARTRGEEVLASHGASPPLLYLLGVVAEATGDPVRAEEMYRKTIYLDPEHAEALTHLATLVEKNGDLRAARTLRERAKRAAERQAT